MGIGSNFAVFYTQVLSERGCNGGGEHFEVFYFGATTLGADDRHKKRQTAGFPCFGAQRHRVSINVHLLYNEQCTAIEQVKLAIRVQRKVPTKQKKSMSLLDNNDKKRQLPATILESPETPEVGGPHAGPGMQGPWAAAVAAMVCISTRMP